MGPAFWIGHSLGGAVSYAAATHAPTRGVVGIGALYSFAQANRALLAAAMRSHGFHPYEKEWWHFTLAREPFPDTYFDFPVR